MTNNYFVYGPIRLDDGRRGVFIGAGYHWGCCQHGEVLFADGHLELVNPDTIHGISGAPQSFDADHYTWHGWRLPLKGWGIYADLKAALDEWVGPNRHTNGERLVTLSAGLPQHEKAPGPHYPWPMVRP